MNNSEYVIDTIETVEKFSEIKRDWERLFKLKSDISIFFSFEILNLYYKTIIKNFKHVKIKIFVIKNRNNKIVAIFPFTYETKRYLYLLSLKELSIKDHFLLSFYNFLIDPQENDRIIFQKFIEYLKTIKWDIVKIYSIPSNEKLFDSYSQIFKQYYKTEDDVTNTLIIDSDRDFNDYINNDLDRKNFRELKRKKLRLKEKGELKFIEIGEEQEVEKMLYHFYDIEDKNWKGKAETSLKKSYYGEYFKKLAIHLSKEKHLKIFFLKLNNEYIAGVYAIIDRGICYLVKIGYNDDYYKYSPSNVLMYMLFEKLFQNKEIKKIDFYGPYYSYQKFYGVHTRKKYNFTVGNKNIRSRLYFFISKAKNQLIHLYPEKSVGKKLFIELANYYNIKT